MTRNEPSQCLVGPENLWKLLVLPRSETHVGSRGCNRRCVLLSPFWWYGRATKQSSWLNVWGRSKHSEKASHLRAFFTWNSSKSGTVGKDPRDNETSSVIWMHKSDVCSLLQWTDRIRDTVLCVSKVCGTDSCDLIILQISDDSWNHPVAPFTLTKGRVSVLFLSTADSVPYWLQPQEIMWFLHSYTNITDAMPGRILLSDTFMVSLQWKRK